jgi:transmembrane sensor
VSERDRDRDDIDAAAARWVARLDGDPLSQSERRELERWLASSSRHVTAFEEAKAALALMEQLRFIPDVLERHVPAARRHLSWRGIAQAAALAASVLLVAAGLLLWYGNPAVMLAADHATAPAERRIVELPDGSSIELGPASAVAVRYSAAERRVELLAGLAFFHPAPLRGGERRPFIVEASNGSARALGTQFIVDRLSDSVDVAVVEHDVAVTAGAAEIVLSPGESVRYSGRGLAAVRKRSVEASTAWRRDRLFFDKVPLSDVVAELNRYRRGRIVVANASLSARTVSGVFDAANLDGALVTICRELGVRTAAAGPLVTVLY